MGSSVRILLGLVVAGGIAWPASGQGVVDVSDPAGLQSAINTAVDGTIIQLAAGTYAAPAGGFRITNRGVAFTIRAASGATVVLDGQNARDVLRFLNSSFGAGRPVTFERLTFANGFSTTGGVAGGVTMQSAQATFVDCAFSNNATTLGSGGTLVAGGSVVHFLRTTWTGNRARVFGGALTVAEAGTQVTIHDSQFLTNRTNFPGHAAGAAGGAIRVANTAPGTVKLRVTNSRFEGNEAGYVGGALYAIGSWQTPLSTPAADVIVANCLFLNNKAQRDASVSATVPTEAGAVHAEDQTTARIYNSRFITNSADTGGAVSVYRADVEVEDSTFRGNRAVGTSGSSIGFGGAVSALSNDTAGDGTTNRRSARLTVRDSLLQGRYGGVTTTGQTGGCLYGSGDSNRLYGLNGTSANGTVADNRATVSISGSVFSDCDVTQASSGGGSGGALFVDLVALNVTDSIVINSDALAGSTTGDATTGGGLTIINQSSASLSDSTLARNTAGCRGGAIAVMGSSVTVDGCHLVKNGVTGASGCVGDKGGTMFSGPLVANGSIPDRPVSGEVRNSTITEGTGLATMIREDDSTSNANRINTIVYNNNQISTGPIYRSTIVGGTFDVAGLNALIVSRTVGINTVKSVTNNSPDSVPPVSVGQIIAVPPNRLLSAAPSEGVPTSSFLGYAWGGPATVSLNEGSRSGNAGLEAATSTGLQTLSVSGSSFTTTVGTATTPAATLAANPPGVIAGGSSLLTWGVGGTFLETSIDQGVGAQVFASGSVNVTPPAATTYRHLAVTKEGGALAAATVALCSTPVIGPWAVPAAVAGSAYSQSFTQIGGLGAITWGLTGTLPTGLTFSASTATLSGTPGATGDFPITIIATDANGCSGSRDYTLTVGPAGFFEAVSLDVDAGGNGVLEPGEVASLAPTWRSTAGTSGTLLGELTFSGPGAPDPSYSTTDGLASYGTVGAGAATGCASATGNCYSVLISVPTVRPSTHWDPIARETLSSDVSTRQIKDWIVHVGGSFDDVPETSPFYPFIETLLHRSVTAGCSSTTYCPKRATTRAQMAVFTLRAKEGGSYKPPACGGSPVFGDVPVSSPFCPWIEELVRRGVVKGCGGGNYCPNASMTRQQMAVFVLKTLDPGTTPPACTVPVFDDVPATSPFCPWVEELARRGVVVGCAPDTYCPRSPVNRQQMGVFIGEGFALSLNGP